jgi:dTDP-4-dehydrorhamnose 3,5-epimerase-like enzyme
MRDAGWISVPSIVDERGFMGIVDGTTIPFDIKRVFWLTNVGPGETRGHHAHRRCRQVPVCASGSVVFEVESADGDKMTKVMRPGDGFVLEPFTWLVLKDFSHDATVIVFASESYDESEYIRSYEEFLGLGR